MKQNPKRLVIVTGLLVLGLAAGLAWQSASPRASSKERKPLFYQDSMHPWIKSDRPGKCTVCEMDLTPIYEGQAGFGAGENVVVISSNQVTVLNVQTEPVKRCALSRTLRVAGTLEANETRKTVVAAPARGRIDELNVDYAGVEVEQGQKLLTLFSPELVQLRKTLLAVRDVAQPGGTNPVTKALMDAGIYTGDILAPQSGVVLERNVYSGQYVAEGDRLFTIVDASMLWFRFDVYQRQLPWFEPGQTIEVEVSGIPGKVFPAVISYVEPAFNEATRTVKVRADLKNPVVPGEGQKRRLLKYGMYAEGQVQAAVPEVLAVPRTAILFPGGTAYAYVEKGGGAYERRRLKLGREGDQLWEVLKGVEEGESVVTSGNMLIDAQAQFNLAARTEEGEDGDTEMAEAASVHAPMRVMNPAAAGGAPDATSLNEPSLSAGPAPLANTSELPTPAVSRPPAMRHAAADRTDRMAAIMSPGSELLLIRREAMMRELASKATNAPSSRATPPDSSHVMLADAGTLPALAPETGANPTSPEPASQLVSPTPAQTATNKMLSHSQADAARRATVADMRDVRRAAIAQANKQTAAVAAPLTDSQHQLLQDFLTEADGLSQALAADNLENASARMAKLPAVLEPLLNALPAPHPYNPLLQGISATKWQPAKDLADARKQFLPFSTAVVALVKQLRKQDQAFAGLKVYHCPMAPKPGLWLQAKAPLANPFYGSEMLRCGEEVKP
jgi:membrane fusion protein, copper/silver efflux system